MAGNQWEPSSEEDLRRLLEATRPQMRTVEHDLLRLDDDHVGPVLHQYVVESNAIEGIHVGVGDPLYDDHIGAVRNTLSRAASADETLRRWSITDIAYLHRYLMSSEQPIFPGEYRQHDASVGGRICPSPRTVRTKLPLLLNRALSAAEMWRANPAGSEGAQKLRSVTTLLMHYEFEYIHPFADGNGRVGRLWLNAVRTVAGLPWLTIASEPMARQGYYAQIVAWCEENTDYEADLSTVRSEIREREDYWKKQRGETVEETQNDDG